MAGNPMVAQGVLNRLRASVNWPAFPALNVTASYLSAEGISLTFEGVTTDYIPTLTGAVTSPVPFQMVTLMISLLRTQGLAAAYEAQRALNCNLGDCTVRGDSAALPTYPLLNCSIENVRELAFAGQTPAHGVQIKGYYLVNSNLWNF